MNPYAILGGAALLLLACWGSYQRGASREALQCQTADQTAQIVALQHQAAELTTAAHQSQEAASSANQRAQKAIQEKRDAQAQSDAVIAGLRAGSVRVRDRFACAPGVRGAASTAADPGQPAEARTGFDAEDAAAAFAITRDGDAAVIEMNQCIDQLAADRAAGAK